MEEIITKYGSIDIAKLHALLVQLGPDLYTTPFYVSSRAGASQRTIVLEKLKAPREQEQNLTKRKPYMIATPRSGRMRLPLKPLRLKGGQEQGRWTRDAPGMINHLDGSPLSLPRFPLYTRKRFARFSRVETMNSLGDTDSQQQPSGFDSINQAQDTQTTTTNISHIPSDPKD
jgi:hypothetical protein